MKPAVAILVGGKSTRMGQDKAWVTIGGIPLIHHQLFAIHKAGFSDIFLIANEPDKYSSLNFPIYPDNFKHTGALGGIESALSHNTKSQWTLVLACDMPFIRPNVLQLLHETVHHDMDVILPVVGDMTQPLCAFYHRRCGDVMRSHLREGHYKVRDVLMKLRVILVKIDDDWCFFNVNTPQALAEAEAYWQAGL